jgi:Reverse transcriptase (RNA-dependent DNA polymerase)
MIVYEAIQDINQIDPEIDWMSPLAYAASSNPDVMYLHEALMQPDKAQFIKAMIEEVEGQTRNKNWVLVERGRLPKGARILPCVWAMRRKRRILDGSIYKWKARLNMDGGKQIRGVDYWETYAPVATWTTIRIVLIMAIKEKWCIKQLDFVQAYPQAPVETELFIDLPKGFMVECLRSKTSRTSMESVPSKWFDGVRILPK